MSDDTRYPCCEHRPWGSCLFSHVAYDGPFHSTPCRFVVGCPAATPVGPTKEGKQ